MNRPLQGALISPFARCTRTGCLEAQHGNRLPRPTRVGGRSRARREVRAHVQCGHERVHLHCRDVLSGLR
jgi:hypothetical protein